MVDRAVPCSMLKFSGQSRHCLASCDGTHDPPCAFGKFCHLRSTWTDGSPSIAGFCFFILSSSFRSASTWAEKRKILRTSHSADGAFPGGPCSLRSSPPKQARAHFSARPAKALPCATTPTSNSRSARSSRVSSSVTFSSSRTTTTKFTRSTNTSPRDSVSRPRMLLPRFSCSRVCLPPAPDCMSRQSRLLSLTR